MKNNQLKHMLKSGKKIQNKMLFFKKTEILTAQKDFKKA